MVCHHNWFTLTLAWKRTVSPSHGSKSILCRCGITEVTLCACCILTPVPNLQPIKHKYRHVVWKISHHTPQNYLSQIQWCNFNLQIEHCGTHTDLETINSFPKTKKKKEKPKQKKSPTKAKLRTNLCPSPRGPYMMSVDPAGGSHTQLPYKTHD